MNKKKPILIVAAEPYSVFSEILFKSFKKHKLKKPLVIIGSLRLLIKQMKFLKYKIQFKNINKDFHLKDLEINKINVINVNFKFSKPFDKISNNSNFYINESFKLALNLMKKNIFAGMINGPISKKHFLKNKYFGITEYLASKTGTKNFAMLIYNKKLAVNPITTHVPLNKVSKLISKKKMINHVYLIKKFYKKKFNIDAKIAITGLNPHCESYNKNDVEKKIINPTIKYLKKNLSNVKGPFPADSIFMRENVKKYNVIVGMYHDQVLTPMKSIHNFDAINITLGLPFTRITPDHGPNFNMRGKNKSNPDSLISAIKFLEK